MFAPSKPCRRSLAFLALWTSFIWLLFQLSMNKEVDVNLFDGYMNTRELKARFQAHKGIGASTVSNKGSTTESSMKNVNIFQAIPKAQKSSKLTEDQQAENLQIELPNLPVVYWNQNKKKKMEVNSTCAKFPSILELNFNNKYWQVTETSNGTFLLYGAYLDTRASNRLGPTVRILGMINRLEPKVKTFCHLWFPDQKEPIISKVLEYKYIWYKKWGNYKQGLYQPYLLACQLPKTHWGKVPASVSVVEKPCETATSNIKVTYNKIEKSEKKKKFAVCVKGLDFPDDDLSTRLIEWIELLNVLGADKIFMYKLDVHPNVSRVLDHYVKEGKIDVTKISLPGFQPNLPVLQHLYLTTKRNNKRQNELIPYNDCLYRNLYRYEYIALLDIDEVIIPLKHLNWKEMMTDAVAASLKVKNETRASYNFRNVYFMDEMLDEHEGSHYHFKDIPPYLHMMQHVYRSANYTKPGQYVKCFHNPERALILHNHFPLGCLGGVCTSYPVDPALGHLQHYRSDCVSTLKKSCKNDFKSVSVKDSTIWKWKDTVIQRSSEALITLGFLSETYPSGDSYTSESLP